MPNNNVSAYKRKVALRNTAIVIICFCALAVSFLVSINTGYSKLSMQDAMRTLFGGGSDKENLILFSFRLPRIVLSILVGAGLALSGCVLQALTRNPLSDPGLLGINAGAGLTVILYVLFFGTSSFLSVFTLPFLAILGAGCAAAAVYLLSWKKGEGIAPMRLILTGVAVQAGILALTTFLVVKLDDTQYSFVASWQAGSIWGANWYFVLALLPWLGALIPWVMYKARVLDVLNLSDETAFSLGAAVEKERRKLLAASVALAASCIAVSGNISFVGLIAPHLTRRLSGPRHAILLPVCALMGAVLVSVSDTIARVIVQPSEIPAGIVVAVIGSPYFLYLLAKSN